MMYQSEPGLNYNINQSGNQTQAQTSYTCNIVDRRLVEIDSNARSAIPEAIFSILLVVLVFVSALILGRMLYAFFRTSENTATHCKTAVHASTRNVVIDI